MGRPKKTKPKLGRKILDGRQVEVLAKLEQAFAIGCTDEEACAYAEINKATLYRYQKRNPEFCDKKERLKLKPILAARQKVVNDLKVDGAQARWFLTKKLPDEFRDRTVTQVEIIDLSDEAKRRLKKYQ